MRRSPCWRRGSAQPAAAAGPVQHAGRVQPRALAPDERQVILDAMRSDRFTDTAPAKAWATLPTGVVHHARRRQEAAALCHRTGNSFAPERWKEELWVAKSQLGALNHDRPTQFIVTHVICATTAAQPVLRNIALGCACRRIVPGGEG